MAASAPQAEGRASSWGVKPVRRPGATRRTAGATMFASVALAAPVLPAGTTVPAHGARGTCTNCHTFAPPAPPAPPVVTPPTPPAPPVVTPGSSDDHEKSDVAKDGKKDQKRHAKKHPAKSSRSQSKRD